MPLYDFKCDTCKVIQTLHFNFMEKQDVDCDDCDLPMRKVIHATPTIFTGDGWAGKK